jgi:hypothetical protein
MSVALPRSNDRFPNSVNADEPPIHWPSAVVGLGLAIVLVVGVSWLASARQPTSRVALVEAAPAAPAPVADAAPPAPPAPAATPIPVPESLRVASTGGHGVNLRASPGERALRIKTIPEGMPLEVIGADVRADGVTWRNVRDPSGAAGWVSASYVAGNPSR